MNEFVRLGTGRVHGARARALSSRRDRGGYTDINSSDLIVCALIDLEQLEYLPNGMIRNIYS